MSCPCEKKIENNTCPKNTPPVIEINGGECPILFHTVVISASQGDKDTIPPTYGAYRNTRVYYEANKMSFLYDSDGVPQVLSGTGADGVATVNGQAGDVIITPENIGAATTEALAEEINNRENADASFQDDIDTLNDKVDDNTTAIGTKANSDDVYTKSETDAVVAEQIEALGLPSLYWGQAVDNGTVSGSITLAGGDQITWGENNPNITGNGQASMLLRSGILESDTSGQYMQLAVGRTGIVIDHYANGAWEGQGKISGVANGTAATDAINLSQIQGSGWVAVGTGSAYNKAGSVVTVNISESGTFPADGFTTVFTLPEGFRPSITITGALAVYNDTTQLLETGVVNITNDGLVQVHSDNATANAYGSVTFIV